ncbi:hypothetical protein MES4922_110057 [Mesorhizobium ventifaucium]|uniref:Uncharacterized protein n=1 Tax=Mesorhizobium ventifaucium TaxID=666020 RepID=A0ABM9DDI6_9HYPH|nr:hypothetical protein MES4922_110057 [Mesorhizobium ventifaucium]
MRRKNGPAGTTSFRPISASRQGYWDVHAQSFYLGSPLQRALARSGGSAMERILVLRSV